MRIIFYCLSRFYDAADSNQFQFFIFLNRPSLFVFSFNRPSNPEIAAEFADKFPEIKLITVDEVFGGWTKAQNTHFGDGGIFDRIQADLYKKK